MAYDSRYTFSREKVEYPPPYYLQYDIDNPLRRFPDGTQVYLSYEVEIAFPTYNFNVNCIGEICYINFQYPLTAEEIFRLNDVVFKHKNNIGPPQTL